MKIIVIGTGKVGGILIEQLAQEGHQIVAIERNEKKLMELQNSLDILCLSGSGTDRNILLEAGVGSAELVIAATDSDEVNMICCLLARKLGAHHTIARVRKPELADEISIFSDDMGLSMTINPELYPDNCYRHNNQNSQLHDDSFLKLHQFSQKLYFLLE